MAYQSQNSKVNLNLAMTEKLKYVIREDSKHLLLFIQDKVDLPCCLYFCLYGIEYFGTVTVDL